MLGLGTSFRRTFSSDALALQLPHINQEQRRAIAGQDTLFVRSAHRDKTHEQHRTRVAGACIRAHQNRTKSLRVPVPARRLDTPSHADLPPSRRKPLLSGSR